jgi:hypothetical protein
MASIKRVTGNYDIYTDLLTVHGNLSVAGTTTTVNTEIVNQDEIITGNLTVNGPLYAAGSKGTSGQVLTSNSNGVYWGGGGAAVAAGSINNIQYNSGSVLAGSNNFNYFSSNGNVQIGTTLISNTGIITTTTSSDLILNSLGSGTTYLKDTLKLDYQSGSTPTNVSNTVQMLANTPGGGGTGLFVVNSNGSDELINKTKATVLALIFS